MNARILVVDDSPVMTDTLDSILSSQGCRVEIRDDGEAGWEYLQSSARGNAPMPDLLLLDLAMPGLDGLTLLDRIRGEEGLSRLPVMIITADPDPGTRTQALGAGADDYLSKPVDISELLSRVRSLSNR